MSEGDIWQRFTNPGTRVIHFAQEEAKARKSSTVGTEHILLGLLRDPEGIAAMALVQFDVSLDYAAATLCSLQGETAEESTEGRLTLTAEAKEALQYAVEEARDISTRMNYAPYVDTEHLLLGLLRQGEFNPDTMAMRLLSAMCVDPAELRHAVLHLAGVPEEKPF